MCGSGFLRSRPADHGYLDAVAIAVRPEVLILLVAERLTSAHLLEHRLHARFVGTAEVRSGEELAHLGLELVCFGCAVLRHGLPVRVGRRAPGRPGCTLAS